MKDLMQQTMENEGCLDKNRLCIFSFFDRDGVVDDYNLYLLKSIREVASTVITVVNGEVNEAGKQRLGTLSNQVVIRPNRGYDGGAYKDILVNRMGEQELHHFDEIILMNNTFFGPFESFSSIFTRMQQQNLDFWCMDEVEHKLIPVCCSYFYVFTSNIIKKNILTEYMRKHVDSNTEDKRVVYPTFEWNTRRYLTGRGFRCGAYTKHTISKDMYGNSDETVVRSGSPLLKVRSFCPEYFSLKRSLFTLKYILRHTEYPVELILNHIERKYGIHIDKEAIESFEEKDYSYASAHVSAWNISEEELRDFLFENRSGYIYGAGQVAAIVWYIFKDYFYDFKGFVISDGVKDKYQTLFDQPVFHYSEIDKNSPLVVALSYKNSMEVKQMLDERHQGKVLYTSSDEKEAV